MHKRFPLPRHGGFEQSSQVGPAQVRHTSNVYKDKLDDKLSRRRHCGFSKNLPLVCCPSEGFEPATPGLNTPTVVVVNTPGVRRGGEGEEEERSGGIPVLEDNFVEEEQDYPDNKEVELEDTNTMVEKEEGERHEEDFGEHLEFEYHEFPVFLGDYAISDEFP